VAKKKSKPEVTPEPAKVGAPKIEIDMNSLGAFMRFKPSEEDCAAYFKCSTDTIVRRIKEHTKSAEYPNGMSFAQFRAQNMVHTRYNLIRTAIKKAESGDNDMLKYCLTNLSEWVTKKPEETDKNIFNIVSKLSDRELLEEAARIAEELKALEGSEE
jgi:hypothetical protein